MKIDKIKKVGNKYKIVLENNDVINTYDDVIINNNILYKKELDDETIYKINKETSDYDIYNKALKYINIKLRSEFEVRKYLEKQKVDVNYVEDIILKLKEQNLINDCLFTRAYIHDRVNFSNDGPYKIKRDLLEHKIDGSLIDTEINSIDNSIFLVKLEKQIENKMKRNTKYSNSMMKQKLLNYYANLGYDKNDILCIIENKNINNSSIIKKEYDKLYNKYKNKYSDDQLTYFVKNKLYQKGFALQEINEFLEQ